MLTGKWELSTNPVKETRVFHLTERGNNSCGGNGCGELSGGRVEGLKEGNN